MKIAHLKHCRKMPFSRRVLNLSQEDVRIEFRHFIISFEKIVSRSHDLGAEVGMHSLKVDCSN